ncbi:MAG TPA: glycosyltransferase family 4 protein [Spirochaetia bacterium]|nr:glycosyltransferase family 4 protein [Spirochaetia bacterium]
MSTSDGPGIIRLVSGLPLRRESSFIRQLRLLKRTFDELSVPAEVSGPPFEDLYLPDGGTLGGIPGGLVDTRPAAKRAPDRARILLGYPDQFHFVTPTNHQVSAAPTFLWTQLSGPPKRSELGFYRLARPVALTERTWSFLAAAVSRFFPGGIPILPHGVDTKVFRPPTDDERKREVAETRHRFGLDESFTVGTVAANSFRKRFDRMFEAFALFHKRAPGAKERISRFVVKTDRIRGLDGRDLSELARRYGIEEEVLFIEEDMGEVELAALFGSFDLYLNLSEWEGFCIPVIEAMACGVPVVSHDVQGPGELLPYAELIVPGSTRSNDEGVLLLDASPEQAAKVLERAYRERKLRARASEIGRRTCVDLYDIHRVADAWLALLSELPPTAS